MSTNLGGVASETGESPRRKTGRPSWEFAAPRSVTVTPEDIRQFKEILKEFREIRNPEKAEGYRLLHPKCARCQERCLTCTIDIKHQSKRELRCDQCSLGAICCPRQVDYWVSQISEKMGLPLSVVADLYQSHGIRRRVVHGSKQGSSMGNKDGSMAHRWAGREDSDSDDAEIEFAEGDDADIPNKLTSTKDEALGQLPNEPKARVHQPKSLVRFEEDLREALGAGVATLNVIREGRKALGMQLEAEREARMAAEETLAEILDTSRATERKVDHPAVGNELKDQLNGLVGLFARVALCRDRLRSAMRPFRSDPRSGRILAVVEDLSLIGEGFSEIFPDAPLIAAPLGTPLSMPLQDQTGKRTSLDFSLRNGRRGDSARNASKAYHVWEGLTNVDIDNVRKRKRMEDGEGRDI